MSSCTAQPPYYVACGLDILWLAVYLVHLSIIVHDTKLAVYQVLPYFLGNVFFVLMIQYQVSQ